MGIVWNQTKKSKLEIGSHKVGELVHLYIGDEYRNKGVGKEFLGIVENYFKENGCDSIWLSVFSPNENAHTFYKKYGFIDREVGMLKQI